MGMKDTERTERTLPPWEQSVIDELEEIHRIVSARREWLMVREGHEPLPETNKLLGAMYAHGIVAGSLWQVLERLRGR